MPLRAPSAVVRGHWTETKQRLGNCFHGAVMISKRSSIYSDAITSPSRQIHVNWNANNNANAADLYAHLPRIWRFALRLSGSSSVAEELVQRTWSCALENQLPQDGCLDVSLMTVLFSIWTNDLGRPRVRGAWTDDIGTPDATVISLADMASAGLFRRLVTVVDDLPEAERSVLLTVVVEGLQIQHAARVLGVDVDTAQNDLLKALRRVEEKLTK
jgi:RNA polymerase sigma-70 factor (ECF subfamily)